MKFNVLRHRCCSILILTLFVSLVLLILLSISINILPLSLLILHSTCSTYSLNNTFFQCRFFSLFFFYPFCSMSIAFFFVFVTFVSFVALHLFNRFILCRLIFHILLLLPLFVVAMACFCCRYYWILFYCIRFRVMRHNKRQMHPDVHDYEGATTHTRWQTTQTKQQPRCK